MAIKKCDHVNNVENNIEDINFYNVIKSRRSVKYYDSNIKIPREELIKMLDLANCSPSFNNLQPWRYIVVDTEEGKSKLEEVNYNKIQNNTSSAVVILLGDIEYFSKFNDIYSEEVAVGNMTEDIKNDFEKSIANLINNYLDEQSKKEILFYDCGLWSMQFVNIARAKGYDTNILGGYNKEKLKELYSLPNNLIPIMLISIGKREKDGRPTTRMKAKTLVNFE